MEQNWGDPGVLRHWEEQTSGAETACVEGGVPWSGNFDISETLKWV